MASPARTASPTSRATLQPAPWIIVAIFSGAIALFVAMVGEVALRLGDLRESAAADSRCVGSDVAQLTQKGLYRLDPLAGYVMQPNLCIRLRTTEYDQVLRTNSRGLVGPELPESKAPGEFRIVILGDSYTVGGQVSYKETFPAVLEEELHQRGYERIRVVNAGIGGYTTYNEAGLLRENLGWLQPDLVVVAAFVGNDVAENILATAAGYTIDADHPKGLSFGARASELIQDSFGWFPRNGNAQTPPPPWEVDQPLPERAPTPAPVPVHPTVGPIPAWVFNPSPVTTLKNAGHWLWDTVRTDSRLFGKVFGMPPNPGVSTEPGRRPPSKEQRKLNVSSFEWVILRDVPRTYWLDLAWPLFGAYLADIRSSAASNGAPAIVLVIPHIAQVEPDERARTMSDYRFGDDEVDWDRPQQELSVQAARVRVPVVDLLAAFRERAELGALYLRSDQHFTALGHSTTAQLLAQALLEDGYVR